MITQALFPSPHSVVSLALFVFWWWRRCSSGNALWLGVKYVIFTDCSCAHYSDVIMSAMASQITGVSIVYSAVCSGADQRKRSSASLAFVKGIHRWQVGSPHKGSVTRKMFPFGDVSMHANWRKVDFHKWISSMNIELHPLQWRHNEHDGVSNHLPHDCLIRRLFRRISKKTSISALLAFLRGIHRWPVNSPHKWPVTWKMIPVDDVIMITSNPFIVRNRYYAEHNKER